jgi:hypothetical protein
MRVVKTDVTRPFCVGCHVSICLNTSTNTNVGKIFIILGLPMLCMEVENKFGHHRINNWKQIWPSHDLWSGINSIATGLVTKNFQSSIFDRQSQWLKIFGHPFSIATINNQFFALLEKKLASIRKKNESFNQEWQYIERLKKN